MPLAFWLYTSVRSFPALSGTAVIQKIVDVSRSRNGRLSITGALFFTGSYFAQYIEGPDDAVATVRDSILADYRHRDVHGIRYGARRDRLFPDWSLAYCAVSSDLDRLVGRIQLAANEADEDQLLAMMNAVLKRTLVLDD